MEDAEIHSEVNVGIVHPNGISYALLRYLPDGFLCWMLLGRCVGNFIYSGKYLWKLLVAATLLESGSNSFKSHKLYLYPFKNSFVISIFPTQVYATQWQKNWNVARI